MRELTERELELAPDWATHYDIFDGYRGRVLFSCHERFLIINPDGSEFDSGVSEDGCISCVVDTDSPMPRFDITTYKWSDGDIDFNENDDLLLVEVENEYYASATINKQDVIALAKHFKLKASEL